MGAVPPLVEDALFHCQQSVEKALKGFLTCHDNPFGKTHDLDHLAKRCEAIEPSLKDVLGPVRALTVFAWKFRYPGPSVPPSADEAGEMLSAAQKAVNALRESLPAGTLG